MEEVSEEEKDALLNLLKAMLEFNKPGGRMTGKQVVKSKWMKKWALPELARLRMRLGG
jgi:hypothetical protein